MNSPVEIVAKTLGVEKQEIENSRFKRLNLENPSVWKIDFHYLCISTEKPLHKGFIWREWHDQYEAERFNTKIWCADAKD
jgi:hypothetical protein